MATTATPAPQSTASSLTKQENSDATNANTDMTTTAPTTPPTTQTTTMMMMESQSPSHITADGHFVILPEPTFLEQRRYMERSIARHGLLQQYLATGKNNKNSDNNKKKDPTSLMDIAQDNTDDDVKPEKDKDDSQASSGLPQVHPLVLASARLENDGIQELNRAINLAQLVQTGEYFSLSNIVAEEALQTLAAEAQKKSEQKDGEAAEKAAVAAIQQQATKLDAPHARLASTYCLKRKYTQFQQASQQLAQQQQRLPSALCAEHWPLQRLRQLRRHWRLVAPEHGTRAQPHPVRPTEVVAVAVDVYEQSHARVPKYATIELRADYTVEPDRQAWRERMQRHLEQSKKKHHGLSSSSSHKHKKKEVILEKDVIMKDVEAEDLGDSAKDVKSKIKQDATGTLDSTGATSATATTATAEETIQQDVIRTRAQPFAIADPTLGKIDTDFDPTKVAMLTLEFAIEKPATGFVATAHLQPFVDTQNGDQAPDVQVLVALQHSLFCSKMFDAIRREVASDTQQVGQVRAQTWSQRERATVWASSGHNEEIFLPPPGSMVAIDPSGPPVAVIHCHEGEVMVQMDCEYTLRVKLVEASSTVSDKSRVEEQGQQSGGHSPAQLLVLCRALMLHAQETYHAHSLQQDAIRKREELEEAAQPTLGLAVIKRARLETSPKILQKCIGLGSKMLMERRVRSALQRVEQWLVNRSSSSSSTKAVHLHTEWLSLSALAPETQFTLSLTNTNSSWYVDVHLSGDRMTVTSILPCSSNTESSQETVYTAGEYRKVDFHSEHELELFLKRTIAQEIRNNE